MGDLDKLLKKYQKPLMPFPEFPRHILLTLASKTEREFYELIETPEISEKILDLVNSPPFKKTEEPIADLRKAVLILGEDIVRLILLAIVAKKFTRTTFNNFNYKKFWVRSLANASFSQILFTEHVEERDLKNLLVTSFLLDFGILVLYYLFPEGYLKVLELRMAGKDLTKAEEEIFKTNHAIVGSEYLEKFSFPRRIILAIRNHHYELTDLPDGVPQETVEDLKKLMVIDLGVSSYLSTEREYKYKEYLKKAYELLHLSREESEYYLEQLPSQLNPVLESFDYKEFVLIPYSQWIKQKEKEIEERLKEIERKKEEENNLIEKYKYEITRLLREKQELLKEIKFLKEKLYKSSILDELTGIYNETFFMKRLQEEILRAKRYKRTFSVILIEIEKLEEIGNRFGSDAEEKALKNIAQILTQALRRVDIVAKLKHPAWFGIILPETPYSGTWVVVRKISEKVEAYFWTTFKIRKGILASFLTYEPLKIDPKKDTPASLLFKLLENGLNYIKEKGQKRIVAIKVDKELEAQK